MYAALKFAASFHCLVGDLKDCEELKPQPKKVDFFGQEKRGTKASNCKHYTSKYTKMATEIQHENNGYEKNYENEVNENYSITSKTGTTRTPTSRPQSTTPMTTLTSTDAWRACIESARTAHLFYSCDCLTLDIPWLKS